MNQILILLPKIYIMKSLNLLFYKELMKILKILNKIKFYNNYLKTKIFKSYFCQKFHQFIKYRGNLIYLLINPFKIFS
jgi:hypothetical protein